MWAKGRNNYMGLIHLLVSHPVILLIYPHIFCIFLNFVADIFCENFISIFAGEEISILSIKTMNFLLLGPLTIHSINLFELHSACIWTKMIFNILCTRFMSLSRNEFSFLISRSLCITSQVHNHYFSSVKIHLILILLYIIKLTLFYHPLKYRSTTCSDSQTWSSQSIWVYIFWCMRIT
jgi:hypothetical protein